MSDWIKRSKYIKTGKVVRVYLTATNRRKVSNYQEKNEIENLDMVFNQILDKVLNNNGGLKK